MARRMSNRARIDRMREEAELSADAKKKKDKARAVADGTGAMRVVWSVCDVAGNPVSVHPYPQKDKAEAEAKALTDVKGETHFVRRDKVPI